MHAHDTTSTNTGAGTGIGRAVALGFLAQAYHVVLAGRRSEKLEQTQLAAGDDGIQALVVPTDVSDEMSARELFDQTQRAFGSIDVLFNNAARGGPPVPIQDLSLDVWRDVVNTNLTGMFLCAQAAIRIMKAQKPCGVRIINNGSISAHAPRPYTIAYTTTKLCRHRAYEIHFAGLLPIQYRLRTDRYWKCGYRDDQTHGRRHFATRWQHTYRAAHGYLTCGPRRGFYGQIIPCTNVQFMTIIATNMPFVERG